MFPPSMDIWGTEIKKSIGKHKLDSIHIFSLVDILRYCLFIKPSRTKAEF